jgi:Saccharopine dehydrogenase NADP binding domain
MNVASNGIRESSRTVAVFGASGHTGRFVIAELLRRGFAPLAVARDSGKLEALRFKDRGVLTATATIDDPVSLDRAFANAAAVINCAGPFLDTANAVAAAAIRSRIHYFDVTAEQPSAQATFEAFDSAARKAGTVVLPATAFYGGLSDLLATAAVADWDFVDEMRIGIGLDSWHPTLGTRITGYRNTARRLMVVEGRLQPLPQPAPERSWDFPEPLGRQDVVELSFSEIVLINRHLRVGHLHTYINHAPLRDLRDANTPPPLAADGTGRSSQRFVVEVIARRGNKTRRAIARGRDIYAVSAPLVCEAAQRILEGDVQAVGGHSPGELFDAKGFLKALAPNHLTFQITSD